MDKPLTKWYCDVCGEVIEDVERGYVIWQTAKTIKYSGFKIIHQSKCALEEHTCSSALEELLGSKGMTQLLAFLSAGPIKGYPNACRVEDMDEFADFFRRLQTPYYEEARRHFKNEELLENFSDANEVYPYIPEVLKDIIEKYSK